MDLSMIAMDDVVNVLAGVVITISVGAILYTKMVLHKDRKSKSNDDDA